MKRILLATFLLSALSSAAADTLDITAKKLLKQHYDQYKALEYFSGASLSVYIPQEDIHNFYIGTIMQDPRSTVVTKSTLFQIGSITKSFTAAVALQLEKEGKLNLQQPLQKWLPAYAKWSTVTLESLLNMTSGLPNYSDVPLWGAEEYLHPDRQWRSEDLLRFVYPKSPFSPPLKEGYYYSNTGYVLTDMIIEKIAQRPFSQELQTRTIDKAQLYNTFYPVPSMPNEVASRIAHGYSYNQYENPELLGLDMINNNLSWAAAAGGIVSTSEDIVKWVKALFIENKILDEKQKQQLTRLISTTTGKPITEVSAEEPRGFGLGVTETYKEPIGRFWFYEGQTLGFRALYMYTPCNGVIIAAIFNSATNTENDHAKDLMVNVYQAIQKQYANLQC